MNDFYKLNRYHVWDTIAGMINTVLAGAGQQSVENAQAAEAHDWAKEDAGHERMWQEMMSNSAHQREVKDLKAAGLNPILSGTGGAGAGGGSVGLPQIDRAHGTDFGVSDAVDKAIAMTAQKNQASLMKAQEESLASASDAAKAQARKTNKEADILGPKSYLYDKAEEALKSGSRVIENTKKYFDKTSQERQNVKDAQERGLKNDRDYKTFNPLN